MRNFDLDREALPRQQFFLAGREWSVRREVRPEALLAYEEMAPDASVPVAMGILDDLVLACLVTTDREAWLALRVADGEDDELGLEIITTVVRWLIAEVIARPTGRPSPSSGGSRSRRTGTPSTGESPSLAAVESPT